MEFDFTSLAFGGEQHIVAWDAKRIGTLQSEDQQKLSKVLDVFGKKSALAQGLQTPVTDVHRLRTTDQRLYLYVYRQSSKTVVLGGLKVGTKRLYVRTVSAELREIEPVCVLDFYVHESCQRQGVGKALFEHFLSTEVIDPASLAYDRPSPKLLAFLRKHYGLQEYIPQSNNYVVFSRYFELNPTAPANASRGSQGRSSSSRSSLVSGSATPHVHPLHGARSTPPPGPPPPLLLGGQQPPAPAPVHPGWAGAGCLSTPSPLAVAPPQPLGNSPSFGRRWAASNLRLGAAGSQDSYFSGAAASGGDCEADRSLGDSLDAFSRAHMNASSSQQQPQQQPSTAGKQGPPLELPTGSGPMGQPGVATAGGLPPASRGAYSFRPPWAVDDSPAGASLAGGSGRGAARTPERLGSGANAAAARGPLQAILNGGAADRDGGGGGPHTRALQQQVAAMQLVDGSAGTQGVLGPAQSPLSVSAQQQWGAVGVPAGASRGGGSEEAGGRGAARIMAVAQRSGAGAADCLVW